jgi:hypothetical protein
MSRGLLLQSGFGGFGGIHVWMEAPMSRGLLPVIAVNLAAPIDAYGWKPR